MTSLVNALRTKNTVTENGMSTSSSSLSSTLDLFFVIGAIRKQVKTLEGQSRLLAKFEAARNEDSLITRKLLFWSRDIRGGAGEREAFRVLLRYSAKNYPQDVIDNIHLISEYGRWDDVFCLFNTPVEANAIDLITKNLNGSTLANKILLKLDELSEDECEEILKKINSL